MEQEQERKPKELTRSQKFFALVARMRMAQKQFFAVHTALSKETNAQKIADMKAQKARLLSNAKGIEKLIDAEIQVAEDYYDKHKLDKFWL